MLVKELIEELQKLDGEKTIGVCWEDNVIMNECDILIHSREEFNLRRNEDLKEFDYYV